MHFLILFFIPDQKFTCKGFGITYHDDEAIHTVNFDVISNSYKGSQDALSVVRAFRILRNQKFFKDIEYFKDQKKELVVWCDCGKHFRNSLVMGYLFTELKSFNIHGMAKNRKQLFIQ